MRMTGDEIRVIAALLLAILIGTATKHYRTRTRPAEMREAAAALGGTQMPSQSEYLRPTPNPPAVVSAKQAGHANAAAPDQFTKDE